MVAAAPSPVSRSAPPGHRVLRTPAETGAGEPSSDRPPPSGTAPTSVLRERSGAHVTPGSQPRQGQRPRILRAVPDASARLTSLADVARRAGVSVTTASRVLSRSPHPVAEGTRRRVLDAAEALDFEPNLFARGLVGQRTHLVGVVVHDVADEWYGRMLRGIEDVAEENGFSTLVCDTHIDAVRELRTVRRLRALRVDAVVYAGSSACDGPRQDELVAQLAKIEAAGGALVRLAPHPNLAPDVSWSTREAFGDLAKHFVGLGHRRAAFLGGPPNLGSNRVALQAVRSAFERRGATLRDDYVAATDGTRAGGAEAAGDIATWLAAPDAPSAVLCVNDAVAVGLLGGLRDRGIDVPGAVSVAGMGDLSAAGDTVPGLTTVRVPLEEIGEEAMKLAIWVHGGGARPPRRDLPAELVVRASTAAPPSS